MDGDGDEWTVDVGFELTLESVDKWIFFESAFWLDQADGR